MRSRLRESRILRKIRFLPYLVPYAIWCFLRPAHPKRILFLSDSHDGFTGNMLFLRDALHRRSDGVEVLSLFKPGLAARRSFVDVLRLPYLLATSGVIVLDDFFPLIYGIRIRPNVRLVQIWHAVGAFKQVGHSRAGLPGGPTKGSEIHRNYTDAVVSSEGIVDDYAEAFGIPRERVHAWGVPRTDVFFDAEHVARKRAETRAALGIADDETFVLFAPTFRGNGQLTARASPDADWGTVASLLGHGWRVGVRQHPFVTPQELPAATVDATAIGDMNELLMATDVLVTDYSSSIFEYALLRRPMVLFVPDLDDYTSARSFYRPFDDYAVGPVVTEAADLPNAIASAAVDNTRLDRFIDEFCDALDGHSSDRIADRLVNGRIETATSERASA